MEILDQTATDNMICTQRRGASVGGVGDGPIQMLAQAPFPSFRVDVLLEYTALINNREFPRHRFPQDPSPFSIFPRVFGSRGTQTRLLIIAYRIIRGASSGTLRYLVTSPTLTASTVNAVVLISPPFDMNAAAEYSRDFTSYGRRSVALQA